MAKSKSSGVMPIIYPDSNPSVSLEGKHAKPFIKHKVGDKVKFVVHGKKQRHSKFNDTHSIGIDIHKIETMDDNSEENVEHEAGESPEVEKKEHKGK